MKAWLIIHQQQLSAQIQQGILPHALLISGMVNSGKQSLAQWLIEVISCQQPSLNADTVLQPCHQCKTCQLIKSQTYPDHQVVSASAKTIGVDEIRAANHFFEKTAQIGQVKTLIIESADKMTVAAGNALLKTLEEPNGSSIIILLSADAEALLATIISRCRLISLRPPMGEALSQQLNCAVDGDFTNLTHLPEMSDDSIKSDYQAFQQSFELYLTHGQGRTELLKRLDNSPYALRWLEKIVVNLVRQQSGWQKQSVNENQTSMSNNAQQPLWEIHRLLIAMNKRLKTLSQSNQSYEFEKLLIDINAITTAKVGV